VNVLLVRMQMRMQLCWYVQVRIVLVCAGALLSQTCYNTNVCTPGRAHRQAAIYYVISIPCNIQIFLAPLLTHTRTRTCTCTRTRTRTHTRTHTHTHRHAHSHSHSNTHSHVHCH
jgi:hypothetical protein